VNGAYHRRVSRTTEASRYREEQGVRCVDVRVGTIEQLFDTRDPAPFRERDLDPDLAEYLLDAGEDLSEEPSFRIVFWLDTPCRPGEIEAAVHAHLEGLIARNKRLRRRGRRIGQVTLALAIVLVVGLIALSQFVGSHVAGSLGAGLREGLVISGWVVMWRPIETLIYDWIPARHERTIAGKLLAAKIEVRANKAE
jgi:hypothetical protein